MITDVPTAKAFHLAVRQSGQSGDTILKLNPTLQCTYN